MTLRQKIARRNAPNHHTEIARRLAGRRAHTDNVVAKLRAGDVVTLESIDASPRAERRRRIRFPLWTSLRRNRTT